MADRSSVIRAIKTVYDIEIPVNVYDLGLIRDIQVDGNSICIKMTWTSPLCPYGQLMTKMVEDAVQKVDGVEKVDVIVELDPPWTPDELTEDGRMQMEMLFGKETVEQWLRGSKM